MIKVSYMLGLQHYAGSTKYVIIAQHVLWFIYFLYSLILLSFYYFNFARWISPFSLHACSAISNFISRRFSSSLTFEEDSFRFYIPYKNLMERYTYHHTHIWWRLISAHLSTKIVTTFEYFQYCTDLLILWIYSNGQSHYMDGGEGNLNNV